MRRFLVKCGRACRRQPALAEALLPLVDEDSDQAEAYEEKDELDARRALLAQAMSVLNDREKDVLMKRRLSEEPVTLEELSESYGVSRERIRQIEVRAFEKVQEAVQKAAHARDHESV